MNPSLLLKRLMWALIVVGCILFASCDQARELVQLEQEKRHLEAEARAFEAESRKQAEEYRLALEEHEESLAKIAEELDELEARHGVKPLPTSKSDEGGEAFGKIVYKAGDTFQGMWNYDRRNANLRLNIAAVDSETRTLIATLQSSDLDDAKKEFFGTIGSDGRQLVLVGVAGSGAEYDRVSGYDVRDFLQKSSTMRIDLDDCNERKLRGSVENGTNIYFWSKVRPLEE